MRSCERPWNRSASEALPSSVSNRYSLSTRTQGSCCRRFATSSLRRVSSFSALSRSSRAASHSLRVPVMCFVIVISPLSVGCYLGMSRNVRRGWRHERCKLTLECLGYAAAPAVGDRLGRTIGKDVVLLFLQSIEDAPRRG